MKATLHYIFDPLCGWCYAASPMVRAVAQHFGPQLAWRFHPGLLMPEPTELSPAFRAHILAADQRIARMTGVPFGEAYQARLRSDAMLVLHSVPAAAAVMTVLRLQPQSGLAMLEAIQRTHYVEGGEVCDLAVLLGLAEELGFGGETFGAMLAETLAGLPEQVTVARALLQKAGGGGFPTFVLERDGDIQRIDHAPAYEQPARLVAAVQALAD